MTTPKLPVLKRYRVSYKHGVISDDGSHYSADTSMALVLATDHDAALANLQEQLATQAREHGAEVAGRDATIEHYKAELLGVVNSVVARDKEIEQRDGRVRELEGELSACRAARDAWDDTAQFHYETNTGLRAEVERLRGLLSDAGSIADEHRGYGEHPEQLGEIRRICEAALPPAPSSDAGEQS